MILEGKPDSIFPTFQQLQYCFYSDMSGAGSTAQRKASSVTLRYATNDGTVATTLAVKSKFLLDLRFTHR